MSYLKSIVKNKLTEIVEETTLTVEVCTVLKDKHLVTRSEYQKLIKYMKDEQHSEGAAYLYTSILDKLADHQVDSFISALQEGGNSKVVTILRHYPPEGLQLQEEINDLSSPMDH